jgi:hypothetical protein
LERVEVPKGVERSASARLRTVKVVHTAIWACFAGCILAIPIVSSLGQFKAAAWLAAIVCGEVIVLLLNSWSCPLTAIAARYTADRNANFDIYLPEWLARNNKVVFGVLYVVGTITAAIQWVHAKG